MQENRKCLLCGRQVDVGKENIQADVNSIPVLLHRKCFDALHTLAQGDATINVNKKDIDDEQQ